MFKRILVPVDGSAAAARALEVARDLAGAWSASLVLLEVISPPVEWPASAEPHGADRDPEEAAIEVARLHLARMAADMRGVRVDTELRTGRPAECIDRAAAEGGCDLICVAVGSHERTPSPHGAPAPSGSPWLLPAVIDRVVHTAPAPVLVVR